MDAPLPTLETLFEQLGLDSSPKAIDAFIAAHPLSDDVKLIDAPFWTPQQAQFLKEAQFSVASEMVATMARVPVVVQGYLRRKRP